MELALAFGPVISSMKCISLSLLLWMTPFLLSPAWAGEKLERPLFRPDQVKKLEHDYAKAHQLFVKQLCPAKMEPLFNRYFSRFQKTRYLIPVDDNNQLDQETVTYLLPRLDKKVKWIGSLEERLAKNSNFTSAYLKIGKIRKDLAIHQKQRRKHYLAKGFESKKKYRTLASKTRQRIVANFNNLLQDIPFLLSFDFPIDHLKSRQLYDSLKERKDRKSIIEANRVYMERKLVEDGAQDQDGSRSDLFLRSTLDTLHLLFKQKQSFLSEEERYDLHDMLSSIEFQLKSGAPRLKRRLAEWKKRTIGAQQFYQHLSDKVQDGEGTMAGKLLAQKAKSTYELKKFVSEKQRDTFLFWAKYPKNIRALFALETILFNEVGKQDPYSTERADIIRLVSNRQKIPYYSSLTMDDSLFYFLPNKYLKDSHDYSWLNTLFKEGEFSFTYFYIQGNLRIFCPDMSRSGKKLREQNLKLVTRLLSRPNRPFEGLRYFSRESMIGRIDMGKVWTQFESIPESPGPQQSRSSLWKQYQKGNFSYLYHFDAEDGRRYEVAEENESTWVIDPKRRRVYGYRNPHQFTFFRLKK